MSRTEFNKIRLLNDITNHIAAYGVSCGFETLLDSLDLNCGAVPEGEYEQVIDPSAVNEFLSLYMKIAESRFAFVVTFLINKNKGYLDVIREFCNRIGREMNIGTVDSMDSVLEVYNSFILDGMPDVETKKIIEKSADKIIWEKIIDTHEQAWEKVNGEISVYYLLQQDFVNGLFEASNIRYEIKNENTFILAKF